MRRRMALNWRLPPDELDAALLLGLPGHTVPGEPAPGARPKAEETAAWARAQLCDDAADGLPARRALFRAIYCDWPDLSHILRLLAAHHARLFFGPPVDLAPAEETRRTYLPAADMLGLWRLRRRWLEESMRRLYRDKYQEAAERLGVADLVDADADRLEDLIIDRQRRWMDDGGAGLPKVDAFDIAARMRLFSRLRRELLTALAGEFPAERCPRIELVPLLPGIALYRAAGKDAALDQALRGRTTARVEQPPDRDKDFLLEQWFQQTPQLQLRLYCDSQSDCYRALGVIHRVVQPIRTGHSTQIREHIAAPQPNGYRALQTVCQWFPGGSDPRLVGVYILTDEMHQLNEWGPMVEPGGARHPGVGLWRSLDRLSGMLREPEESDGGDRAVAYLRDHNLADACDPIYCFTPLGEIFPLRAGSLPLDFAYRVHTQLGNQAARIDVNGRPADLTTPLQNGDLVRITFDTSAVPLDFDWQEKVRSKSSRNKIRAELRRRAGSVHAGRRRFEDELIRQLDLYRRDAAQRRGKEEGGEGYRPPVPTTAEIDRYLDRVVLRRHLSSARVLYEQMEAAPALVARLAHRLISEKIIRALRAEGDGLLFGKLTFIELCASCRPTSLDRSIRALLRDRDAVIIHRPGCKFASPTAREIDLRWAEQDTRDDWPLYRFEINTLDDDGLLIKLLEIVREMPHAYLFRVDALVSDAVGERNRAYITFDVAVKLPQHCADLKSLLERAGAEVSYDYLPTERRRTQVRPGDLSREINNPYTLMEVTDWRFYDRDRVTHELMQWISGPPASPVLLLHGQRRVGKSSLVLRLIEQKTPAQEPGHRVIPVWVDFSIINLDRPETLADLIVQRVYYRAGWLPIPIRPPTDDPMIWLDRMLLEAETRLRDDRLLIVVDEFDAELEQNAADGRPLPVLARLRTIIGDHRAMIRWLLIVQDVYLADPQIQAAFPVLPTAVPRVRVGHLDRFHARRLITAPMLERGYDFGPSGRNDVADRIVDLTAGNPYFIHLIGGALIERLQRDNRRTITAEDLERVADFLVAHRPVYLSHFTDHLSLAARRLIAVTVAEGTPEGGRLPLAALVDDLVRRRKLLAEEVVRREVSFMEDIGVLDVAGAPGDAAVGIPIRLLHRFLRRNARTRGNSHWQIDVIIAELSA